MKYSRLTLEQLEALHEEFARFLATQSITPEAWSRMKAEEPQLAEDQLDLFSDLIWEGVLNHTRYLDHRSAQQLMLFHATDSRLELIAIRVIDQQIDLQTREGLEWLGRNLADEKVDLYTSHKSYSDRNTDLFDLIQKGAVLSQGEWYKQVVELL
jgi:hypothetical protein